MKRQVQEREERERERMKRNKHLAAASDDPKVTFISVDPEV